MQKNYFTNKILFKDSIRINLLMMPILMEVKHGKQYQQQKQYRSKEGNGNCRCGLSAEFTKYVAHLVPLDMGVPFESEEADSCSGSDTRVE